MPAMAWLFSLLVLAGILVALALRAPADVAFTGALAALMLARVVPPGEALAGFANPALVTIAALLLVVEALRQTGAMELLSFGLLGAPRTPLQAARKVLPLAAALSAWVNNTAIVAVFVPLVAGWARWFGYSAAKLLLPLVFATSLGGLCTLVGTSTNLVVAFLAAPLGVEVSFWTPAPLGVPVTLLGLGFLVFVAPRLLPERADTARILENSREYAVEMQVASNCSLVGKSVEEAGLRHLVGVYLAEVQRGGRVLPAVPPTEVLAAGDRLVFVGAVETIVDLQRIPGLLPATDQLFKLDTPRHERQVVEVVLSGSFSHLGETVRGARFRTVYNAVVLAVSRGGRRLPGKVGDIRLEAGDTLLLEAPPGFAERYRASREFFLVSRLPGSVLPQRDRAWTALAVVAAMLVLIGAGLCSPLEGGLGAVGLLLLTRCLPWRRLWREVDWPLLLTLGSAMGVGHALEVSGAAGKLAQAITALATSPGTALTAVFFATVLLTQLISNNAAAALVFPVAAAVAQKTGASLMPFAMAVMVAASCAFLTPWGYQTNLLVQGPGNYRLGDYLRVGLPLLLLVTLVSLLAIPQLWPLESPK